MAVNFSDSTARTHEDFMFSPSVAAVSKVSHLPQSFITKEDSDEGTVLAGGPVVRNKIIMTTITSNTEIKFDSGSEKENKMLRNILDMMLKEFIDEVEDEMDGIAMFILSITRLTKGVAYGLVIFHKGDTLFLETLSKKKVRHSWEEPVKMTEMLKILALKQDEAMKQELRLLGIKKLESILGRVKIISPLGYAVFIPQNSDVFSHLGDEKHDEYCWLCHVTIRKLKKSTCAGCLVARYCTLGCQENDWSRHRDYCMKKKARREEKNMSKIRENLFIDWEKEVD